jgi:hypothetical protein
MSAETRCAVDKCCREERNTYYTENVFVIRFTVFEAITENGCYAYASHWQVCLVVVFLVMTRVAIQVATDVSEEHFSFTFRVEGLRPSLTRT